MNAPPPHQRQLGQILIAKGILTEDQLRIALLEQMKSNQPVGKLLVSLGLRLRSDAARRAVGKPRQAERRPLERHRRPVGAGAGAARSGQAPPPAAARLRRRAPAPDRGASPTSTTSSRSTSCAAWRTTTIEIDTLLAGESEIERAIDQYYGHELSIDGILHEIETGEIDFRGLQSSADEYSQPVVRLIDALLTDAVKRDASDIHFEPEAGFLRIRYRIDGMLRQIRSLHKSYWPAMAVRIKVMAA